MSVAVREGEHSTVVQVEGELDLASAVDLGDVIERVRRRPGALVIDLGQLRFMDMAGLRVLVAAQEGARRDGRQLVLRNVREPIRRVLRLAQVHPLLSLLDGEDGRLTG